MILAISGMPPAPPAPPIPRSISAIAPRPGPGAAAGSTLDDVSADMVLSLGTIRALAFSSPDFKLALLGSNFSPFSKALEAASKSLSEY